MKRLALGILMLAMVAIVSMGCAKNKATSDVASVTSTASSVASLASDPLISSLMSGLGLNATQATGGAGALLGLAQEKLTSADWSKVASAIPGASQMIAQAKSLGGITGKFGSLANLAPAFSKMGLTSDQVKSLTPAVTDYVSKAVGPEIGGLMSGAIE